MQDAAHPFAPWESYYVIVGSSGAALTGLQFVVVALTTELRRRRSLEQFDAFATPTIVHFCAALLISVMLSAPWERESSAAVALGLTGASGLVYCGLVMRRLRKQTAYAPVFEDWLFHTALPLLAYAMVLSAGLTLAQHTVDALFGVAAASVLLLFIGIHNAWDTVTFLAAEPENGASAGASAAANADAEVEDRSP
jgi:hypothetical protein